jgi:hypothetical protein
MTSDRQGASPIFLHALFRSGSTWLYQAFRRLGSDYTCFQEPLHEVTLLAQQDSSVLLAEQGREKMRYLRHPELDAPYFSELHALPHHCLEGLDKADLYDGYFGGQDGRAGLAFWRGLIDASGGRVVIQECRSAGRIGLARRALGGFHAYLWRNPRDQWWSYQVAPYFDCTSRLILNAPTHPPLIALLRERLLFQPYSHADFREELAYFEQHPLPADDAYRAFYALWLMALQEGLDHSHLLLNLDGLSASAELRRQAEQAFAAAGVAGLSLEDCRAPAAHFSAAEEVHFTQLEEEVHQLWVQAGLSADCLRKLLDLRRAHAPTLRPAAVDDLLLEELQRSRDLVLRRTEDLRVRAMDHERRLAARDHALANQQRQHLAELAARDNALHAVTVERQRLSDELELLRASLSWRITGPLRNGLDRCLQLKAWLRAGLKPLPGTLPRRALAWLYGILRRYPRLLALALSVARHLPIDLSTRMTSSSSPVPPAGVLLNPRSRMIYAGLTAAVAERRQEATTEGKDPR